MARIDFTQGTTEWLAWRSGGLGGSDIGAIALGASWPWKDSRCDQLFRKKVTGDTSNRPNWAMRRGSQSEGFIRELAEFALDRSFVPVCWQHDELDFVRVSLDGYAEDFSILEIKRANTKVHDAALSGRIYDYYVPQCRYQLFATGAERLFFVNFSDNAKYDQNQRLAIVELGRDEFEELKLVDLACAYLSEINHAKATGNIDEHYERFVSYREKAARNHSEASNSLPRR